MEKLTAIVQYIVGLGPTIVMPIIIMILGTIFRIGFNRSISSAIKYGVAFGGVILVVNHLVGSVAPAAQKIMTVTGANLTALDVPWGSISAIVWSWAPAVLMFPLQILINAVMLYFGWTKCANVDMWNVFHKGTIAWVIIMVTGNYALAFIAASLWIILELKSADFTKEQVFNITRVPGVAVPHNLLLDFIWLSPFAWIIDRIPGLDRIKVTPTVLRDKIGVYGESAFVGFVMGVLLGIIAKYDLQSVLGLGINSAIAFTLFPLAAGLFMEALAPFAEGVGEFFQKRFPDREIYMGVDAPVLFGAASTFVSAMALAPLLLVFAVILPGNTTIPFASIILIAATVQCVVLGQNDLIKTFLLSVITGIAYLYSATYFAPYLTAMAKETPSIVLPTGTQLITSLDVNNAGTVRIMLIEIMKIFSGKLMPGIIILPVFIVLYLFYLKEMKRREKKAMENSGGIAVASGFVKESKK